MPCRLGNNYRHFEGELCLYLQDRSPSDLCLNPVPLRSLLLTALETFGPAATVLVHLASGV
jgi:hypothetical protein